MVTLESWVSPLGRVSVSIHGGHCDLLPGYPSRKATPLPGLTTFSGWPVLGLKAWPPQSVGQLWRLLGPPGLPGRWSEMASIPDAPLLVLGPSLPCFTRMLVPMVLPGNILYVNFIPELFPGKPISGIISPLHSSLRKIPTLGVERWGPQPLLSCVTRPHPHPTLSHSFVV